MAQLKEGSIIKKPTGDEIIATLNDLDGIDGKDGQNGIDGKDGYTPVRGVDYYTDADKAEMVSAVLVALPVYEGEVESV